MNNKIKIKKIRKFEEIKMNLITLFYIIVYFAEIFIILFSNNNENYNLKIFITLIVQAICLYELKKSDDNLKKLKSKITTYQ